MFTGGDIILEVRKTKACSPFILSVFYDSNGDARYMRQGQEIRNRSLDLDALFFGNCGLLGP